MDAPDLKQSPKKRGERRCRNTRLLEIQRALVEDQQFLLLLAVGLVHATDPDDLAHDLGVEAGSLGLGIDLANIGCQRRLFLLEPLDALDEGFEPVRRDSALARHSKKLPV